MLARRPSPRIGVGRFLTLVAASAVLSAACSRIEPSTNADSETTDMSPSTTSTATESTATESTDTDASTSTTIPDDQPTTTVVEATVPTSESTTTTTTEPAPDGPIALVPEVLNTYPHDPLAFTQGLVFHDGKLIEGVGEYGRSSRRIVDSTTGVVALEAPLPLDLFGNGLAVSDDRLIQLTWQSGRAIVADPDTLEATGQFTFDGEGWGLCAEEDRLIMSNGTSTLTFRDPTTFEITGTVDVTLDGQTLRNINELECVDGMVWANVWLTSIIVQIDPDSGEIVAIVDAESLIPADQALGREDVLNGIAFDAARSTYFVTGKRWNTLYEVRFVPAG